MATVRRAFLVLVAATSAAGSTAGCHSVATRGGTIAVTRTADLGLTGGNASLTSGWSWLHAHAGVDLRQLTRADDPQSHGSATGEVGVAVSGLGVFDRSHELEPYLDLGLEGGVGVGALHVTRVRMRAESFGGAWVEVGLPFGRFADQARGYPVITFRLRATERINEWDGDLVYLIGVGWRSRRWETLDIHD